MNQNDNRSILPFACGWLALAALLASVAFAAELKPPSETEPMKPFPPYLVGRTVPKPIQELEAQGKIAEAEHQIDTIIKNDLADEKSQGSLKIEGERLRRLQRDFSLTPEAMLAKLRQFIPDATAADLENYRKAGTIQWIEMDGKIWYFRREPSNLFRFSNDAKARRDAAQKKEAGTKTAKATETPAAEPSVPTAKPISINDHAAAIVAAMKKSDAHELLPVSIRAHHTITVKPGVVPEGKTIRCWMPYPQIYRQQGDVKFISCSPKYHVIAPSGVPQRTIFLEQPAPPAGKSAKFSVVYEYTIYAYTPRIDPDKVTAINPNDPKLKPYLEAKPPDLLLTPEIRKLAASIVGNETNPYRKAEKIFRWINSNIHYVSEMEYSVMPSVLEKVAYTWKGDCGVHVIMFDALCRASGVPARWQSGWVTRPGAWNLHDWAEFYAPPYGWLPADPSFGLRDVKDPAVRDFYFGHLDSYRMIANLDFDAPFQPGKKSWRSDPVDNQRGEVEWDGGNLYYDDWDYNVTLDYLPLNPPSSDK